MLALTLLTGVAISRYRQARLARLAAQSPVVASSDSGGRTQLPPSLDLNSATARQLEALPGIGPVLAGRIVERREQQGGFRRVSELRSVPGLGPKRYAAIKDFLSIGPADTEAADSSR